MKSAISTFFRKYSLYILGFAVLLLIFFVVSSQLTQKKEVPQAEPEFTALKVKTFTVGKESLQEDSVGVVKNLTSITLVAQTAGPIQKTFVTEGKYVKKGAWIANQSTAYATGNVLSVQRQIAQKNLLLAEESLKNTVEVVSKNREIADKSRENTEELRKISEQSISGTQKSVELNKQIIKKIESDITALPATASADSLQGLRTQLLTYQNILNGTEAGLKSLEYQVNTDKPLEKLANLSKDLVYKSTEMQLKAAEIGRDISSLGVKAAQITEGLSRVAAPFAGKIERLYVQPGQYVNPGTPIAKLKGDTKLCLSIEVSGSVASRISVGQPLKMVVKGKEYSLPITHITTSPTSGKLFEVLAAVPAQYEKFIQEDQSVDVMLPIASTTKIDGNRYLPVDAVFLTNTNRFIFVVENGTAKKRDVQTGEIVGDQIEILEGVSLGDQVILDRRVTDGQKIEVTVEKLDKNLHEALNKATKRHSTKF